MLSSLPQLESRGEKVAIEERILVVAARRSDVVSATRGRIEGTTGEVVNRGDVELVTAVATR